MEVMQLELEVGQSISIDSITLTVIEVQGDEVSFKIDDDSSLFPIRLSELMPNVPK